MVENEEGIKRDFINILARIPGGLRSRRALSIKVYAFLYSARFHDKYMVVSTALLGSFTNKGSNVLDIPLNDVGC